MFFKVITTIAVTVAVFILAPKTPDPRGESNGIAMPLTKRSDTDARKSHATSHNAKIIHGPSGMDGSERNTGTSHPSAVKRDRSGAGVYLAKYVNGMWYGTIWIGTPPKSFTVQLNTGFSDLFVPASTGDENCRSHHDLWDPAASSQTTNLALDEDFSIEFADGRTVSGKQYTDSVTIAGFTADSQTIGAATTCSSTMKASAFAPDGILGLAFPSFSDFHGKSPLFHTLFNEGKLSQPVFSLKLTTSGGELYVGGMNKALYIDSTLAFTPVTSPAVWQLKIDNIQVDGEIVLTDIHAVIDTGAKFILGDPLRVAALHQAHRGTEYKNGYYYYPCKDFPTVTFTIGGKPFPMPADVLNQGRVVRNSPYCFTGMASLNEDVAFWSIGTIFLQQFYTVYDFNSDSPRIGFAELQLEDDA